MSETITLSVESVEAVARRTAEILREIPTEMTSEVMSRSEAKAYVKRNSEGAFYNWCKEWHVKPYHRGRYSKTHLDRALSLEARKRAA
jgi:hypothetical protein